VWPTKAKAPVEQDCSPGLRTDFGPFLSDYIMAQWREKIYLAIKKY
jgi:hypothetical protein